MAVGLAAGGAATDWSRHRNRPCRTSGRARLGREPDLDEEPDFEDEPDLEVFDLLYVPVLPLLLVPAYRWRPSRWSYYAPRVLPGVVLVTLPEETVEDFFALR